VVVAMDNRLSFGRVLKDCRRACDLTQEQLAEQVSCEVWGSTGPLRVRMALHTGVVELCDGDYIGIPLNRVARLITIGHGAQTIVSQVTADLLQDHLPPDVRLRDLGEHRLKDLTRPEHIFQLGLPICLLTSHYSRILMPTPPTCRRSQRD